MENIIIPITEIQSLVCDVFESNGVPGDDARTIAETIIDAESSGIESHGLTRVSPLIKRLNQGLINPKPNISVSYTGLSTLKIDGDNGFGQIVASKSANYCIKTAKETGSGIAAIHNSNHLGTTGYYARYIAENKMFAFVTTNAAASMAPFGGKDPILGTNPIAVAFPSGNDYPFVIDCAMTMVARGKIRTMPTNEIPLGWALDKEGKDTKSKDAALHGTLLPIGGHKGFGLAMVVDALCGILAGANLSIEINSMFSDVGAANLGHFMIALDISRFVDLGTFLDRTKKWFEVIKNSELREGYNQILIPGELEHIKKAEALKMMTLTVNLNLLDEIKRLKR